MEIKKVELNDLENLRDLYYMCFNIKTDIDLMQQSFLKFPSDNMYILKEGNIVIGNIKADIINNIFGSSKPYMYISELCIHPNYRNKGYATFLLNRCEQIAKDNNCEYIFLNSKKDKIEASRLYINDGYKIRDTNIYKKILD